MQQNIGLLYDFEYLSGYKVIRTTDVTLHGARKYVSYECYYTRYTKTLLAELLQDFNQQDFSRDKSL
jgi:hypothetical protein